MRHYHIRICNNDLVFSAAHFITFEGNVCERLHGHNYRAAVEVHGPLNEAHYVVDFTAVRDILRTILAEFDHRVLLPTEHPSIRVTVDDEQVEVAFERRRWVFPRDDCLLLPIANTTAELLAGHLGQRLLERIRVETEAKPLKLRVELDECYGQVAVCELRDE